ncbi:MAG: translation elongation factor Ts [Actinobacteria bacterium]|nr:translation elongation factor Ts [Actinomycetota bacterium]MBV8960856.1 translation elongation factor Ts [Actinomycetota bacterium]
MAEFTAKDVQRLRQATGAGMMDAKKALEENDGDFDQASQWLREKGLASSAKRADRESSEGAVALARSGNVAALVELRSETDFVAKSPEFVSLADELAQLVADKGEDAVASKSDAVDDLKVTLKENISVGRVVRFDAAEGNALDTYLHIQSDRGVNGVLVELKGGSQELAHDVAVHIAFARPQFLRREEVPAEEVEAERKTLETITRNEGKPEQAMPKIVEGRLNGWFKERVLLEQPYAKDDKQTITQILGGAEVVRFAQIEIGK